MASLNKVFLCEQYAAGKSIPEIASTVGKGRSTVRFHLLACGVKLRSRGEGVRLAAHKIGDAIRGIKRAPFSESHRAKIGAAQKARPNAGVSYKSNGYVEITTGPNKSKGLHRVMMERKLGRPLSFSEVVHHIDGNKHNNHPSNLSVMMRSEHTSMHRRGLI